MPQLAYITRGNASPQGKPRVYFCCHPADQAAFLQPMAKELLAPGGLLRLVRPGTRHAPLSRGTIQPRSRSDPDAAVCAASDHPAAQRPIARHGVGIPACQGAAHPGVAHFAGAGPRNAFQPGMPAISRALNPNQTDPTARPYAEKLKKFLESVLIGDALATQVRAAFDAYIFLSYRKKDRREAQALMRLIHESEFCRDIAIWYDEFLTPGEDFHRCHRPGAGKERPVRAGSDAPSAGKPQLCDARGISRRQAERQAHPARGNDARRPPDAGTSLSAVLLPALPGSSAPLFPKS